MAPLIVKNHIIVGVGGDAMDVRGYLESRDPETGELQWRWYTTPEKMGDPGSETWPNQAAMDHGGGMTWLPGTYDPDLNLLYWGTGNANPVFAGQSAQRLQSLDRFHRRAESRHRQAGLVFPGIASRHARLGQRRNARPVRCQDQRQAAQTAGTGRRAPDGSSSSIGPTARTSSRSRSPEPGTGRKGVDAKGQPIPDPDKEPKVDGSMIDMPAMGATNWPPPSYSPQTELFYLNGTEGTASPISTTHPISPKATAAAAAVTSTVRSALFAHGYPHRRCRSGSTLMTGEVGGGMSGGILTTAGNLLFTGDSGNLVAFDPATGKILWHQQLTQPLSNGPST